jgi:hypothetical protein
MKVERIAKERRIHSVVIGPQQVVYIATGSRSAAAAEFWLRGRSRRCEFRRETSLRRPASAADSPA